MEIDIEAEQSTESYKKYSSLTLKMLTRLKISTNIIKNIGRKSTKLYNKSYLMKLTISLRVFGDISIIMQINLIINSLMSKITCSE